MVIAIDLQVVRRDIEQAERHLEELRSFEKLALLYANNCSSPQAAAEIDAAPQVLTQNDISLERSEVDGKIAADAAEIVLRKRGRPMRTTEMIGVLERVGYGANLANLKNALFTAMDRKEGVFEKVERGIWGLREWKNREASTQTAQ